MTPPDSLFTLIGLPLLGGSLLGLSATLLLGLHGRVAGISGIVGGLLQLGDDWRWRVAFVLGLFLAGLAWMPWLPEAFVPGDRSALTLVVAGLLVGVGTRMGSGCTSGHGICGLARFSPRSLTAVVVFLSTGIATATLVGVLTRGAP